MQDAPRGIHRRTPVEITESLQRRFWKRVEKNSPAECWPWIGALRNGYGAIKHGHVVLSTHVVSFVMHGGVLEEGTIVTHSCDNRMCVNPAHLSAGTATTNVREMYQRRKVTAPCGREIHNAVLNDDLVREIRRIASENGWGEVLIARHLGLSRWAVKGVLSGKNWKHVI